MSSSVASMKTSPDKSNQGNIIRFPSQGSIVSNDRIIRLRSANDNSQSIIKNEKLKIKINNDIIAKLQTIDGQKQLLEKSQNELNILTDKARSIIESEKVEEKESEDKINVDRTFGKMTTMAFLLISLIIITFGFIGIFLSQYL